jgi:hypothetical protein
MDLLTLLPEFVPLERINLAMDLRIPVHCSSPANFPLRRSQSKAGKALGSKMIRDFNQLPDAAHRCRLTNGKRAP